MVREPLPAGGIRRLSRFGRILADLRREGRPIPTDDVRIAAHAMESGAELVSFDPHLRQVDGLAWTDPGSSLR